MNKNVFIVFLFIISTVGYYWGVVYLYLFHAFFVAVITVVSVLR